MLLTFGFIALTYNSVSCCQAEAPSDSDDEDEFVYNPLKLPLGYDGKPIPYWLYKLHGLNQVQAARDVLSFCGLLQKPLM